VQVFIHIHFGKMVLKKETRPMSLLGSPCIVPSLLHVIGNLLEILRCHQVQEFLICRNPIVAAMIWQVPLHLSNSRNSQHYTYLGELSHPSFIQQIPSTQ
jgi:hypothetical protein